MAAASGWLDEREFCGAGELLPLSCGSCQLNKVSIASRSIVRGREGRLLGRGRRLELMRLHSEDRPV
uniref:Uncharacterized protein n=1 Tax=Arundo donax TaxID=35708 RepID=A0A0A8ZPD1_ARUDO